MRLTQSIKEIGQVSSFLLASVSKRDHRSDSASRLLRRVAFHSLHPSRSSFLFSGRESSERKQKRVLLCCHCHLQQEEASLSHWRPHWQVSKQASDALPPRPTCIANRCLSLLQWRVWRSQSAFLFAYLGVLQHTLNQQQRQQLAHSVETGQAVAIKIVSKVRSSSASNLSSGQFTLTSFCRFPFFQSNYANLSAQSHRLQEYSKLSHRPSRFYSCLSFQQLQELNMCHLCILQQM